MRHEERERHKDRDRDRLGERDRGKDRAADLQIWPKPMRSEPWGSKCPSTSRRPLEVWVEPGTLICAGALLSQGEEKNREKKYVKNRWVLLMMIRRGPPRCCGESAFFSPLNRRFGVALIAETIYIRMSASSIVFCILESLRQFTCGCVLGWLLFSYFSLFFVFFFYFQMLTTISMWVCIGLIIFFCIF